MIFNVSKGSSGRRKKEFNVTANIINVTPSDMDNYYLDANLGGTSSNSVYFGYLSVPDIGFTPSRIEVEIITSSGTVWGEIWDEAFSTKHIQRIKKFSDGTIYMCSRTGDFYRAIADTVMFCSNDRIANTPAKVVCYE